MSGKRLAIKSQMSEDSDEEEFSEKPIVKKNSGKSNGLTVADYTDKSVVVIGDTVKHSDALGKLGGKYNPGLRIGPGWIFTKNRKESIEKYIETGIVEPFAYSQNFKDSFKKVEKSSFDESKIRKIFQNLREAFDIDNDYDGQSIIDVIYQLEKITIEKN